MKTAHFTYRCRRCGASWSDHDTAEERATQVLAASAVAGNAQIENSLRMVSAHLCNIGGGGIGDLTGYYVTEE